MALPLTQEGFEAYWKNPANPGGFAGARAAAKDLRKRGYRAPVSKVLELMKNIPSYAQYARLQRRGMATRHVHHNFGVNQLLQADLAFMPPYKDYTCFLVVVDMCDGFLYARPIKKKETLPTREAFADIFRKNGLTEVTCLGTDAGGEFTSQRAWLASKGIRLHIFQGRHKAFLAERAVRSLKSRLYPALRNAVNKDWVSLLPHAVFALNNSPNAGIGGLLPADVHDPVFEEIIRQKREEVRMKGVARLPPLPPLSREFNVGDLVFIEPSVTHVFYHSYQFSRGQLYRVVHKDTKERPYMYKLVDLLNRPVLGRFYAKQLEKGPKNELDMEYPVQKIVAKKKDATGREKVKVRYLWGREHDVARWLAFFVINNRWFLLFLCCSCAIFTTGLSLINGSTATR